MVPLVPTCTVIRCGAISSICAGRRPAPMRALMTPHALPLSSSDRTTWASQSCMGVPAAGVTRMDGFGSTGSREPCRNASTGIVLMTSASSRVHAHTTESRCALSVVTVAPADVFGWSSASSPARLNDRSSRFRKGHMCQPLTPVSTTNADGCAS
jgi:hypothetical protein